MKTIFRIAICRTWLLLLWLGPAAYCGPVEHVVIVSLDGARPGDVQAAPCSNILAMAAQGAFCWRAQTVNPSVTLIAHSSMLTGCQPGKHGVEWNEWLPEAGYVRTSTCFELVKKSGGGTAMFVAKEKLRTIAKPGTVDKFERINGFAEKVTTAAAAYFKTNRPALMFVHYNDPDAAGHGFGWGSASYREALRNCDRGIGILRAAADQAGLASNTLFIVTADHGGHAHGHGTSDPADLTIPWVVFSPGQIVPGEIKDEVSVCDTAPTAVSALGLQPDPQWDGKARTNLFTIIKLKTKDLAPTTAK
jgi:arylsulfatase A-like enzyme